MPLMLLAMLLAARPAPAESPAESPPDLLEVVGEAGDFEAEDEWVEEDEEEWGEEAEEDAAAEPSLPEECLLLGADAQVFASEGQEKVQLVLRYSSLGAIDINLGYKLNGDKGPLSFPRTKRHLSKRGVLRLTERLSEAQMERVRSANGFTVEMALPGAPRSCQRYFTKRLTAKRVLGNRVVWSEPASRRGRH